MFIKIGRPPEGGSLRLRPALGILAAALALGSGLGACADANGEYGDGSADSSDPETLALLSDEERILVMLSAAGFDTSTAIFDETHVSVEGDIRFEKRALLERIEVVIEKGYEADGWTIDGVLRESPDNSNLTSLHMCFRFASDVPSVWKTGVRVATRQWNDSGRMSGTQGGTFWNSSDINFAEVGSGSHPECTGGIMEVTMVNGIPGAVADCQFPIGNKVGTGLRLNSADAEITSTTNNDAWREFRVHLALHEIGHCLGLAHPGEGDLISGTASGEEIKSVMRIIKDGDVDGIRGPVTGDASGGGVPRLFEPTSDDRKSLSWLTDTGNACWLWLGDDPRSEDVNDRCAFDVNSDGTIDCQCGFGEGDCDSGQCKGNLSCVSNIGARYGRASDVDICERPSSCDAFDPADPDGNLCTEGCPCGVGLGDCDDDGDCGGRLICGKNNGASVGLADDWDVCKEPRYGGPAFNADDPSGSFCTAANPCSYGEGDCDSDSECSGILTCVDNIGARFGLPSNYEVCVDASLFE